jgi:trehalose utilization protein
MHDTPIRVLVWDENAGHVSPLVYPRNIRGAVADGLLEMGAEHVQVHTASLDNPHQGLSETALQETDVLIYWGLIRHSEVSNATAARVTEHVRYRGLGFIALHSAHYSKPFRCILNCTGHLKGGWRADEQPEEIHICAPHHPIAHGVRDFTLAQEEMYGAPFDVPPAEVVVLQSYFPAGGEYFPSGLVWTVGAGIDPDFGSGPGQGAGQGAGLGRVFFLRPGHESVPTYLNSDIRRIIYNAVRWAAKRT